MEVKCLEEVEELIQILYSPNHPCVYKVAQDRLQTLQKSQEGWQLAQALISSPNTNTKFFAALTLIVKLNKESANLTEDEAKELLQNVVGWLLTSANDGTANFVLKKLCSALVAHFTYFSHLWPKCVRQLVYCLDIGRSLPVEALDEALQTDVLIGSLDAKKMWVAIQFATALVEEVSKTEMNSERFMQAHQRLAGNAADVVALIERGLTFPAYGCSDIALNCYQAWILYAQRASVESLTTPLKTLVEPAMRCFTIHELFQETAALFTDVLQNYSSFLTDSHYEALFSLLDSPWAVDLYNKLRETPDDHDAMSLGSLLLAFGDAKMHQLMTSTEEAPQRLLGRLAGLTAANGHLAGEDNIFVPALEFWSSFVELVTDCAYSESDSAISWRPYAEQHIQNVVINCLQKIQWPPAETFAEWDSSDRQAFGDARKDVADMLQAVFALNGVRLVSYFIDIFIDSLQRLNWSPVEAAEFCLGALADCVTEAPEYDREIGRVFSTPFFELLGGVHGQIPLRLRQTSLSLIERYCDFFERHSEHLPNALNLLFAAVGDPVLGGPSARSISTLCSSCRTILTGQATAFITHYRGIREGKVLDSIAEEKLIHAIACIIQAIPQEDIRLSTFSQLYQIIREDILRAQQLKLKPELLNLDDPNHARGVDILNNSQPTPEAEEIALQISLRALRCLSSMAKGLQDPKDPTVNLEAEAQPPQVSAALSRIQTDIFQMICSVRSAFDKSGEVVEAICNIFRAGFSETEPGPFVLPAMLVTQFFTEQPCWAPSFGTLLSTACSLVGSLYRGPQCQIADPLSFIARWVVNSLYTLADPTDIEISQNSIVLVDKIMDRYPILVFTLPADILENFFKFTLKVLSGEDPLPKGAAADFWSGLVSKKLEDQEGQTFVQPVIDKAMLTLGPLLAQSLINNFGGKAARSELERLSNPFKKLVMHQPRAQEWLESALFDPSFPDSQVTPEQKTAFLKKVVSLRGSRMTNQVLREFWLACRGSNFAYAS
ncbi:armadillo-type protein [Podospora aff. communis PSN243]|uniref:Armadillo-type protein n=1 Tax=Podospora aff. communis PSN243 TaxID=3040156 RepID=A0AAV9GMA8_9PEZI|nr:armadillo-type protein [Podospora aff. communis PSN243]